MQYPKPHWFVGLLAYKWVEPYWICWWWNHKSWLNWKWRGCLKLRASLLSCRSKDKYNIHESRRLCWDRGLICCFLCVFPILFDPSVDPNLVNNRVISLVLTFPFHVRLIFFLPMVHFEIYQNKPSAPSTASTLVLIRTSTFVIFC